MSDKPADISQDVWDAAEAIMNSVGYYSPHDFSVMVATDIMMAKAEERAAKDALIAGLLSTFTVRDDNSIMILEKDNQKFVAALVALSKVSQD